MKVVTVNARGGLTLPKSLRNHLGSKVRKVIAGVTEKGVLLRPDIEIYSRRRVVEFERNNEDALKSFHLPRTFHLLQ